jgi:hypothetical protein
MADPLMQLPAWQLSMTVHTLPSSHRVPSTLGAFVQLPVAGSQLPSS